MAVTMLQVPPAPSPVEGTPGPAAPTGLTPAAPVVAMPVVATTATANPATPGQPPTVELGIPGLDGAVEIGRGGYARVYRAHQRYLQRLVAVKIVGRVASDPQATRRFWHECQVLGRLGAHRHIVTVYDAGLTAELQPYLVMEFLPGGSLTERLQRHGRMPWYHVLGIGQALADALATVHATGVLHRDVKPSNILLAEDGRPVLADFGISRHMGVPTTTVEGFIGSLPYASPEVLQGGTAGEASDVWSLAATLYTAITGSPPFGIDLEQAAVAGRIVSSPPPPLAPWGVPPHVEQVLAMGLSKHESWRPSAAAFRDHIAWARHVSSSAPPPPTTTGRRTTRR